METISYPRLLRRVQAVLIDSVILPLAIITSVYILGLIDTNNISIKVVFLMGPVLLLEPFLVAFTGGTIGHHILKLRVRRINTDKNINIILAIIRFVLKFCFGWMSLVLILVSKRHQALHDYLVSSIVVNKSAAALPVHENLPERIIEKTGYIYPSKFIRIIVMSLYSGLLIIGFIIAASTSQSIECGQIQGCETGKNIFEVVIVYGWLFLQALIIIYCWRCKMYGCRRKNIDSIS